MNIINKLQVVFKPGGKLSSDDLNSLVTAINTLNYTVNNILKSYCDINQETGLQKAYTLGEAIKLVPEGRRSFTMKIRFIENADIVGANIYNIRYAEYYYTGPKAFDNRTWENEANWTKNVPNLIDGGTW
jgi:hypothetical protein